MGGRLVVTAIFDAPRERVFAAWTDPKQVQVWWGCAQATAVVSTVDLRVGGVYRHVMQVAGCGECTVSGEFIEVDPPRRLAFRVKGARIDGHPEMPETTTAMDHPTVPRMTATAVCPASPLGLLSPVVAPSCLADHCLRGGRTQMTTSKPRPSPIDAPYSVAP
jgi:uncharacterized protein YndB with AHSA1/START domain